MAYSGMQGIQENTVLDMPIYKFHISSYNSSVIICTPYFIIFSPQHLALKISAPQPKVNGLKCKCKHLNSNRSETKAYFFTVKTYAMN
jgi:hypothetical protein